MSLDADYFRLLTFIRHEPFLVFCIVDGRLAAPYHGRNGRQIRPLASSEGPLMAKIVLGLGTSHTPMLLASDETLRRFQETDEKIKHRDKEGRPVTYGDLLEKADPKLAHMVAPEHLVARQNVARAAIKHVAQTLASAKVDALIVIGDDQNESYKEDCRPTFAIYYGETIRNSNEQHEEYRRRFPEWYVENRQAFFEDEGPRDYPVHHGLEIDIIDQLMEEGFDLAASKCLPEGEGEGHAIAYVHRRVMDPM